MCDSIQQYAATQINDRMNKGQKKWREIGSEWTQQVGRQSGRKEEKEGERWRERMHTDLHTYMLYMM